MRRRLSAVAATVGAAAVAVVMITSPAPAHTKPDWLDHLKDATRAYQSVKVAKADGYGKFKDADGIACIDMPGEGGMGVHFVNGDLVGDGAVLADHPEALVYQPTDDGMRLVSLEYIVFRKAWRAEHPTGRPELYGQRFEAVGADNRYGIPPFFELHVWAWKKNPSGMFNDWNPRVSCP